jgi:hypothetical protein
MQRYLSEVNGMQKYILRASILEPFNKRSYAITRQLKTIEQIISTIGRCFCCLVVLSYFSICGMKNRNIMSSMIITTRWWVSGLIVLSLWGGYFAKQPSYSLSSPFLLHIIRNSTWICIRQFMKPLMCSNILALNHMSSYRWALKSGIWQQKETFKRGILVFYLAP